MAPKGGAGPPGGIVNGRRDIVLRMRTHTYSIAVHAYQDGRFTVAVVETTLLRGGVQNVDLIRGPVTCDALGLEELVRQHAEYIQDHVRQDQASAVER